MRKSAHFARHFVKGRLLLFVWNRYLRETVVYCTAGSAGRRTVLLEYCTPCYIHHVVASVQQYIQYSSTVHSSTVYSSTVHSSTVYSSTVHSSTEYSNTEYSSTVYRSTYEYIQYTMFTIGRGLCSRVKFITQYSVYTVHCTVVQMYSLMLYTVYNTFTLYVQQQYRRILSCIYIYI